jgi:indole-3-glycerol phosphate synthase
VSEDFLQQMAESSRERVLAAMGQRSHSELLAVAKATTEPAPLIASGGFDLIAEVKLRSPAVGLLKQSKEDIASRVTSYAAAGAAAISVLTEPSRFDGSMAHLESAASALAPLRVPAMRKDFVVDPYQVIEARAAGAGGVLIILRMLPRAALEALIEQTLGLQLFALLEAFDERDIELAHSLAQQYGKAAHGDSRVGLLVGLNCRDLVTLKVVPGRLESLASLLPTNVPRVAESGVGSPEDARQVAAVGYEFALVGSALMTAADPRALVRDMLAAGRSARSSLPSTSAGPGGNARSG